MPARVFVLARTTARSHSDLETALGEHQSGHLARLALPKEGDLNALLEAFRHLRST
jgi:hypothetical protein